MPEILLGTDMNAYCDSDVFDDGQLDYHLCSFPGSRLEFRGPEVSFDEPFVAVLGGTETFGKYVARPFPALLSETIQTPVMNFGVRQGGLSLLCEDNWLLEKASRAELTVFQVPGAQNMSNRLYSVHGRRNDRFISVSTALRAIFPTVDFADVNFTGHLLSELHQASRAGFDVVVEELKSAWVRRMRRVLATIDSDVLLLWIGDHHPEDCENRIDETGPAFVDQHMLDALQDMVVGTVEYVRDPASSVDGMVYPEGEVQAARSLLGPAEHADIAQALVNAMTVSGDSPGTSEMRARASGL